MEQNISRDKNKEPDTHKETAIIDGPHHGIASIDTERHEESFKPSLRSCHEL